MHSFSRKWQPELRTQEREPYWKPEPTIPPIASPPIPLWPWLVCFPAPKSCVWRPKQNPVLILRITLKTSIKTEKLWTSSWSTMAFRKSCVFWAVWVSVAEFWGFPYLCDEFGQLLIAGGGGRCCAIYTLGNIWKRHVQGFTLRMNLHHGASPECTPLEQQRKEMSVLPPPTSWVKVWTYAH